MMGLSKDTLVVGVIVLVALAWAVRSVWRAVRAKKICSTCASGPDCPLANPQTLQDLTELPGTTPQGTKNPETKS